MRLTAAPPSLLLVATAAIAISQIGLSGCSARTETAIAAADSTMVRPATATDGPNATITFCRKFGKRTGKPIGAARRFTIRERGKVRALIQLTEPLALGQRPLSLHIVWLDPAGKTVFKKRLEVAPAKPVTVARSAISITPGKRGPGVYRLQVYLFRELIAEKSFELVAAAAARS